MEIRDAFEILRQFCGNNTLAARHVGLSPEHYRMLRNGRANIPARTADFIILKAKEIAASTPEQCEVSHG